MKPDEMKELAQLLEKVPGLKGIDFKDVKRLAELLRDSPEIGSIELKGLFGTGVVINRVNGFPAMPVTPPMMQMAPPLAPHSPPAAAPGGAVEAPKAAAGAGLKEVRSPMVGTYYASPEPGADAYVKVGSRIAAAQTVCIIEAMKIMNEIEAEFGGVIREVCVEDAQPVEFGQVLFRVDPNG
ncbi:MAG: acetyl-CoA carboxylase biotin carboxyl carrier protein [Gemmatimonadales bacterium]|nr:acetyl-CoA carboxylase biotin carboxyl carrier protein [Gemmatimonadales bacterium]